MRNFKSISRVIILVIITIFGLSILSCSTLSKMLENPIRFDENTPIEDSCFLYFSSYLKITSYNGIPIEQKTIFAGTSSTWNDNIVILPAGEMEFTTDVFVRTQFMTISGKDLRFKYKFEPGKEYCLGLEYNSRFAGVGIYQQLPSPSLNFNRENLIATIPFY